MTSRRAAGPNALLTLLTALFLGACNLGQGDDAASQGVVGSEALKPGGGGTYFVDPNEGGGASRLQIVEMFWGRLVDVHDSYLETNVGSPHFGKWVRGNVVWEDFVINESFRSDTTKADFENGIGNFLLEANPVTLKERLVIRRTKGEPAPSPGAGTFVDLVHQTTQSLPPIDPKSDDGSSIGPFSFIARNSVVVLRFNDILDDDAAAEAALNDHVQVLTGYRPVTPYLTRLRFDPNHGGVAGGSFHSTRILVDMTISEFEAASMATPLGVNVVGLPASLTTTSQPNVSIRIPSREDFGTGQFTILRSYSGKPMATTSNGPVDWTSPTLDVVRAMRGGGPTDDSNGFLMDEEPPQIVGGWQMEVTAAALDPTGAVPGRDFVIDIDFSTACQMAPREGDIISLIGGVYFEVTQDGVMPNIDGEVGNLRVNLLTGDPITGNLSSLLGLAIYMAAYDETASIDDSCWVSFTPLPETFPATGVKPNSQVVVRFSEPMDPDSVSPFDTVFVVRGDETVERQPTNTVVGVMTSSPSLKEHTFVSLLPFAHTASDDPYHIDILTGDLGASDLAGNPIATDLPKIEFSIDPTQGAITNGGIVLRFEDTDEWAWNDTIGGDGLRDLRGQIFYDLDRGRIQPRSVQRVSYPADFTNPVPSIFVPVAVQAPLNPLGAKVMAAWRYCEFGMNPYDETLYDLNVEGLNWAPPGGQIVADYFEKFEIRFSHSLRLPDEGGTAPLSGLNQAPARYDSNILSVPGDQVVVHNRALGYQIDPTELFLASSGTQMIPYPLNRDGNPYTEFIWRDTANLGIGGEGSMGMPTEIEALLGLAANAGDMYAADNVPTIGLPLLIEYRCFPSSSGLGVNSMLGGLATPPPAITPFFRLHSAGGYDANFNEIRKDPDLEISPTGGFNPAGAPTLPHDNVVYIGQLDTVIGVSRMHSAWFDPGLGTPDYVTPVIAPTADDQPDGTGIVVEFRGAAQLTAVGTREWDADELDAYGNFVQPGDSAVFFNDDGTWKAVIDDIDGAAFVQMRFTFVNNTDTQRFAELDSIGFAFAGQ